MLMYQVASQLSAFVPMSRNATISLLLASNNSQSIIWVSSADPQKCTVDYTYMLKGWASVSDRLAFDALLTSLSVWLQLNRTVF